MKCPVCSTESDGRFCPGCGSPLGEGLCRACQTPLVPGARFCTSCGAGVFPTPNRLPWMVAGAAIAALVLVLVLPVARGGSADDASDPAGPPDFSSANAPAGMTAPGLSGGAGPAAGTPPALSDDPRVNADRLFNRIMEERGAGNTEQAQFFLPMAIRAYGMAEPLDDDGVFHLALLQSAAGEFAVARTTAERILARNADHLLALAAAGEAMAAGGDTATAREYYRRFLAAYDREKEKVYPEYIDHAQVLPEYATAARALVGS